MKNMSNVRVWVTLDTDNKIVSVCSSRAEARKQKKYAAQNGWKQRVAKLEFSEFVR